MLESRPLDGSSSFDGVADVQWPCRDVCFFRLRMDEAPRQSRKHQFAQRQSVGQTVREELSVKVTSSTICLKVDDGESVWNFVTSRINFPMVSAWD